MEISLGLVLTLVGLGIVQLAAGVVLGRCLPLRRPPESLSSQALAQLAQEMFGQVDRVAGDVTEHRRQIESVQHELTSNAPPRDPTALGDFLVRTVKRVLEVNERLQSRLLQAEGSLELQGEQLRSHITAALTDPLTGLCNRRAFEEDLGRRLVQSRHKSDGFCLMMLDADHFKKLNDRYGHQTGDEVLKWLAGVLRTTLGERAMIARIGGEEFVAILPRVAITAAAVAAQEVLNAVQTTPLEAAPVGLQPTLSLGLTAQCEGDTIAALLKRADEALYHAKKNGRQCGYYRHLGDYRRIEAAQPAAPMHELASAECDLLTACSDLRERVLEITSRA